MVASPIVDVIIVFSRLAFVDFIQNNCGSIIECSSGIHEGRYGYVFPEVGQRGFHRFSRIGRLIVLFIFQHGASYVPVNQPFKCS